MPVLVPNQSVEKWRISRLLAQGGQGAVYEAFRDDIGQRGALKVLIAHRVTSALLQRFINEARAVNAIKHPSIPQVMDHGVFDDGTAWMVMEFIDGETLDARLAKRRVSREEALSIAENVASALDAAHKKNIIHRDIKPSNIIIVAEEDLPTGERAMVLDFGIAKLIEAEGVTHTGNLVGTPIYMAYEQGVRAKDVDGRADVYSLGVVLYQMLTRRVPFRFKHDEGPIAVLAAKTEPSTPIEKYAPNLPGELRSLVNAMVQKDRKLRPTMAEVRAKLRQLQGLQPARQTGSHDALAALAPGSGPLDEDEDEQDPTSSAVVSSFIDAQEVGPTPSEQKAFGEVSPSPLPIPVPASLSDVHTGPTPLPPIKAGPEDRTAQPAPTQLVPEASATPSAPTFRATQPANAPPPASASPTRRRIAPWAGGALAISALVSLIVLQWPPARQTPTPTPTQRASVEPALVDLGAAMVPRSSETLPDLAPPPERSEIPEKTRPTSRPKCSTRLADAGCIVTHMAKAQRQAIEEALKDNAGVPLCPGERLIVGGLPHHPTVMVSAPSFRGRAQELFMLALKGLPTDIGPFPDQVEIRCPK